MISNSPRSRLVPAQCQHLSQCMNFFSTFLSVWDSFGRNVLPGAVMTLVWILAVLPGTAQAFSFPSFCWLLQISSHTLRWSRKEYDKTPLDGTGIGKTSFTRCYIGCYIEMIPLAKGETAALLPGSFGCSLGLLNIMMQNWPRGTNWFVARPFIPSGLVSFCCCMWIRQGVDWSPDLPWCHFPLLVGFAGGINLQPDVQWELSCPYISMLRVALSTILRTHTRPPPQKQYQGCTETQASPQNLASTEAPT